MTHHIDNRQVRIPGGKRTVDVLEYCHRNGLSKQEERKLTHLFGRFATRHELEINAPKVPKHR